MGDIFSKKLADILGKMDEKVLEVKLNAALDMLKKGNTEELAKKINKVDKDELMTKINEFDETKLKELNINKTEIAKQVSDTDLRKLESMLGENGPEIVKKIKSIINK